jgi:hypothetical protein
MYRTKTRSLCWKGAPFDVLVYFNDLQVPLYCAFSICEHDDVVQSSMKPQTPYRTAPYRTAPLSNRPPMQMTSNSQILATCQHYKGG